MKFTLVAVLAMALLFACGPDPGPFFTPPPVPENQSAFNRGHIGLLIPKLTKENELIAFRLLNGLTVDDVVSTVSRPHDSVRNGSSHVPPTGQQAWIDARRGFTNPPGPVFISVYRNGSSGSSGFVFYLNCLDDAFETAAHTLGDRRTSYQSAAVLTNWIVAQDQVFENCSSEHPAYPDALPAGSPALARADREYQIAAAHFYAQDLTVAEQRFRAIAADSHSPWQYLGVYLAGRALLRKASLQNDTEALAEARRLLTDVANDKSRDALAASARGLVEYFNVLDHAGDTLKLLSNQLVEPHPSPALLKNSLQQAAFILMAPSFTNALSQPNDAEAFDWVQVLEKSDGQRALESWHSKHSTPWLTLAVMFAAGSDPAVGELVSAADQVPYRSAAFGTVTYNSIRLHLERGEVNQLRPKLDNLLLAHSSDQPDSLVNAWRAERMRTAVSFDDLLRWAPRKAIDFDESPDTDTGSVSSILAYDSAYVLNFLSPLEKLNYAARSHWLPSWSASDVALAGWTRAFMLHDLAATHEFAPLAAKAHPDWAASLSPQSGMELGRWEFQAALLIALHSQLQPLVPVDYRKKVKTSSWWCSVTPPTADRNSGQEDENNWIAWRLPSSFKPATTVLSSDDQQIASRQLHDLQQKGSAPSFLAPIVMAWAHSHPNDPLVPQALHRLVVVTRYGCGNRAVSKAAFDLLHSQYPNSYWAIRTPYWF